MNGNIKITHNDFQVDNLRDHKHRVDDQAKIFIISQVEFMKMVIGTLLLEELEEYSTCFQTRELQRNQHT